MNPRNRLSHDCGIDSYSDILKYSEGVGGYIDACNNLLSDPEYVMDIGVDEDSLNCISFSINLPLSTVCGG